MCAKYVLQTPSKFLPMQTCRWRELSCNVTISIMMRSYSYVGYLLKVSRMQAIWCTQNSAGSTHYSWSGPFPHWNRCYCYYIASV